MKKKLLKNLIATIIVLSPLFAQNILHAAPRLGLASVEELGKLVDKGAYADAYVLGQTMLFDHEGEPDFDFLYALSALETGNVNEGAYIFERLVENDPANLRYRLELGRAYFLQRENEKSKTVFEGVLKSQKDLPKAVKNQVRGFLAAINKNKSSSYASKRSAFNGFVGMFAGHDNNPGSASVLDTFLSIDGSDTGNIALSSKEEDTPYVSSQLALKYSRAINNKTSLELLAFGQHTNNTRAEAFQYEISNILLGVDLKRLIDKNLLNAGIRFNKIERGGEHLYNNASLAIGYKQPIRKRFVDILSTDLTRGTILYPDDDNEESELDVTRLSVALSKQKGRFHNNLTFILGRDDAILEDDPSTAVIEAQYNSRDYYGISYGLAYTLNAKSSLSANLMAQDSAYDEVFPTGDNEASITPNSKRDALLTSFTLSYAYAWTKKLRLQVNASTVDNDSDLNLYTFTNDKLEMGATYQF